MKTGHYCNTANALNAFLKIYLVMYLFLLESQSYRMRETLTHSPRGPARGRKGLSRSEARGFFQVSKAGTGSQSLGTFSGAFPVHEQGAEHGSREPGMGTGIHVGIPARASQGLQLLGCWTWPKMTFSSLHHSLECIAGKLNDGR